MLALGVEKGVFLKTGIDVSILWVDNVLGSGLFCRTEETETAYWAKVLTILTFFRLLIPLFLMTFCQYLDVRSAVR